MSDPASYKDLILADAPLFYLPLDSVDGATDVTGNGRSGTGIGGVTIGGNGTGPGGILASSTAFDNTNDGVQLSYSPFTNGTTRTYEAWLYRNAVTADVDNVFGCTGSVNKFMLRFGTSVSDLTLFMDAQASATRSAIWANVFGATAWHHLLLVINEVADTAQLYIDGAAFSTAQTLVNSTAYNASPDNFQIGSAFASGNNAWNGQIAHVAVYNGDQGARALDHYNWGLATVTSMNSTFGLPATTNFPTPEQLPTGDNKSLQW